MPKNQKLLHIITEAGSIVLVTPTLFYIGSKQTNLTYKYALYTFGVLNVLIDGYLLLKANEWDEGSDTDSGCDSDTESDTDTESYLDM